MRCSERTAEPDFEPERWDLLRGDIDDMLVGICPVGSVERWTSSS